ncbi:hypothetical protein [Catellatospora tritici]|uniref:hypothetical protein n=1 Tax=Catellatospora tritici TaxID=2851566 RepID=UPI001C2D29D3|nr:hypothetical protein [Catellatospora tritici]MBV1851975.1 hypothetical protein [Catellatospora tritici]
MIKWGWAAVLGSSAAMLLPVLPAYATGGSDLAVGARPAVGKVNSVVALEVSIANLGPEQLGTATRVRFDYTAPPGTRFVGGFEDVDCNLREDSTTAECYTVGPWTGVKPDGTPLWRAVQVRIDGPVTGRGSLKVTCSCDPNRANDQVPLLVNDPGPAASSTPLSSPVPTTSAPARSSTQPAASAAPTSAPSSDATPESAPVGPAAPVATGPSADPGLGSASRTLIIIVLVAVLVGLIVLAVAVYLLRRGTEEGS